MKRTRLLLTALPVFAFSAANAQDVIYLDFEGVGNEAQILDFYNGGTDSAGNSGVNYGVSFNSLALGLIDSDVPVGPSLPGNTGNFANEPTPDTILFFEAGSAILNFSAGFETGFSFFYSASEAAQVTVHSEIGATGTLLATINLAANSMNGDCVGDPTGGDNCNWDPIGASFAGMARSIDFSGAAARAGFDNVTFGAVSPVPLPAGVWLLLSGLAGFGVLRRRG